MALTWEKDLKPIFRPKGVHMGWMEADPDKCTSCGLCIENCLFRAWDMDENNIPQMKEDWPCFSCYNCMIACPVDAISIVDTYHVDKGEVYETLPHPLPAVYPLEPRDAKGKPDQWNEVERVVFTRRSVRNFLDKPVPEPIIRRVLEAGRHAPSGGNAQPWKFIVITNKALISEMNEAAFNVLNGRFQTYIDDEKVKELAARTPGPPALGSWDPRIILGAVGKSVVDRVNPVLRGAPAVILIACDSRAIDSPEMQAGICAENMVLVANSLGIKASHVGLVSACKMVPAIINKLGIKEPFRIITSVVLGYPRFKQEGVVPREFRPITWFREGVKGPEIEDIPPFPEIKK